jgi:predicted deacylase
MLYSADITAGNAAPHFRTENGNIIKLYQNAAVTSAQGIANALTNLGVLASSTIAASIPTHDGATYDTNAIQTLTAAEYAAITPNASTLYFIV